MISVICCTNRYSFLMKIIENYKRQILGNKELIIVSNSDHPSNFFSHNLERNEDIHTIQCPEKMSLGSCLNKAVSFAKYDIVARFDDDDYYGPNYLIEAMNCMKDTDADVIGKGTIYVFFQEGKDLGILNPFQENKFISEKTLCLVGATLVIKKSIFNEVLFPDCSIGEDYYFIKECYKKGYRLYSTSKENFVYFRYSDKHHTSNVSNMRLRKHCSNFTKTSNIISFIDKEGCK